MARIVTRNAASNMTRTEPMLVYRIVYRIVSRIVSRIGSKFEAAFAPRFMAY